MCVCVCVCVLVTQSFPTLCNPMDSNPLGSYVHGILQNTGVGCHFLLQEIFPMQGSNQCLLRLLRCRFFTVWATGEAQMTNAVMVLPPLLRASLDQGPGHLVLPCSLITAHTAP